MKTWHLAVCAVALVACDTSKPTAASASSSGSAPGDREACVSAQKDVTNPWESYNQAMGQIRPNEMARVSHDSMLKAFAGPDNPPEKIKLAQAVIDAERSAATAVEVANEAVRAVDVKSFVRVFIEAADGAAKAVEAMKVELAKADAARKALAAGIATKKSDSDNPKVKQLESKMADLEKEMTGEILWANDYSKAIGFADIAIAKTKALPEKCANLK